MGQLNCSMATPPGVHMAAVANQVQIFTRAYIIVQTS
jgi:hypothetical protein